MLAVIFVRVGSRHNGGECNHRATIRRESGGNSDGTSVMYKKKTKRRLQLSPFTINRKPRAKPADGK